MATPNQMTACFGTRNFTIVWFLYNLAKDTLIKILDKSLKMLIDISIYRNLALPTNKNNGLHSDAL